jgi:hypothetical protein
LNLAIFALEAERLVFDFLGVTATTGEIGDPAYKLSPTTQVV